MSDNAAVTVLSVRGNEAEIRVGDRTYIVPYIVKGSTVSFSFDGEIYSIDVDSKGPRARSRHRRTVRTAVPELALARIGGTPGAGRGGERT